MHYHLVQTILELQLNFSIDFHGVHRTQIDFSRNSMNLFIYINNLSKIKIYVMQ